MVRGQVSQRQLIWVCLFFYHVCICAGSCVFKHMFYASTLIKLLSLLN